ncbi:selenophosphate synthase [Alkalicella caledoniensis]|uniref:Selenophosphate synthase n=1 Tax=Alkalicella caledoniensis TaxID=2731377 RepID=A0A7G9W5A9_ALKCA|nr:AIR synthase related protein [Alkalicella caledoniensis]QNO13871.1 selenophosphate synthase [Alkalicella caledoniensis]
MRGRKFRDLTLVPINDYDLLVISCDSSGGIGNKENDLVKVPPSLVGYYTAHVALCELLAIGAKPVTLINTLSVEMDDAGKEILKGIKRAISLMEEQEELLVTGTTEENIPVSQTAMGLTVIGTVNKKTWQLPKTNKGSLAVVVGLPKVGEEVSLDKGKETLSIPILNMLAKNDKVQEILPVGSKGILYEIEEMAGSNNLSYILENQIPIDLKKSAGPATCAIFSVSDQYLNEVCKDIPIPFNILGRFI